MQIECRDCAHSISDSAKACVKCGCPVIKNHKEPCSNCQLDLPKNATSCTNCGNLFVIKDTKSGRFRKAYNWEIEKSHNKKPSAKNPLNKLVEFLEKNFGQNKFFQYVIRHKIKFGIGLFTTVILLIGGLSFAPYTDGDKVVSRSCKSLYSELDRNKYNFDKKYTVSTPVKVTGSISSFRKTFFTNEVTINLRGRYPKTCSYNFPASNINVSLLSKGQNMAFNCRYIGQALGQIVLHGCKL